MHHFRGYLVSVTLVVASTLAFTQDASAWGNSGHRIICQIALEQLTPEGQALVDTVKAMESSIQDPFVGCTNCPQLHLDDGRSMTFQGGCLWPDESRRDTFKGTYEYHFINVVGCH